MRRGPGKRRNDPAHGRSMVAGEELDVIRDIKLLKVTWVGACVERQCLGHSLKVLAVPFGCWSEPVEPFDLCPVETACRSQ
jgi:hypothetical protein